MKFACGRSAERRNAKKNWHRWFAWHPVRVGKYDCRWLENIERKGTYQDYGLDVFWLWEYRALTSAVPSDSAGGAA